MAPSLLFPFLQKIKHATVQQGKQMAPPKKKPEQETVTTVSKATGADDDFAAELIRQVNKAAGSRIAFNLDSDDAPTNIKRWISTGSVQLDYILGNRANAGLPEGRIIEIQGPPSAGKSHIAYEIAKSTQALGGIVVYIDTENATSLDNLKSVGVKLGPTFVFIQETCMEQIFQIIESTVEKARDLMMKKDVPVTVIWDSIAASAPKAEIEGDYDQNTIGLAARVLSKGLRKITHVIGDKNILLVLLNQQRMKIGVMYGDPTTTPGGNAIPYHASVRIKLTGGQQIKKTVNGKEAVIGINVTAKTIKNKVAPPWREVDFEIHFGKGIREDEQLFDALREFCEKTSKPCIVDGKRVVMEGTAAWKYFYVNDVKTGEMLHEAKFQKSNFREKVLDVPAFKPFVTALMDACFIAKQGEQDLVAGSTVDAAALAEEEAGARAFRASRE